MVNITNEFIKQYESTYIMAHIDGEWLPFLVHTAEGNSVHVDKVWGTALMKQKNTVRKGDEIRVGWENIDTTPPMLGCINLNPGIATYTCWSQMRQWKRGFRRGRIHFRTAMSDAWGKVLPIATRNMFNSNDDVWNVFFPHYPSFMEAVRMLQGQEAMSVAFNRKYWVSLSPMVNDLILGYKMWPVGVVDERRMSAQLFPDFSHLMNELSITVEVNPYGYGG